MLYTSFVVISDTPVRLRDFLVTRSVIKAVDDGDGGTAYTGVLSGMEWQKVPNPIQTAPASGTPGQPGYVPPTYDTRACFLVKFAHESEADQATATPQTDVNGDPVNQYDWSKFGQWVKANATLVDAPLNYLINGVWAGQAYKINLQNVWLVRDAPERFGVWQ